MENATKALIIAGGMLLAILIVSLLIYAWSLFSEYQSSKDSLLEVEDTAKFNEQFANYDRDGVQGYELLSLVNKVIDYNYRKSNDTQAKNDDKYKTITISINFLNDGNRKKLTVDGGNNKLFTQNTYSQSTIGTTTQNPFNNIIQMTSNIESLYGNSDNASKIAKGFNSIFLGNYANDNDKINAVKKFNSLSSKKYSLDVNGYNNMYSNERENVYIYYEFMQFKRSLFNSVSNQVEYDDSTGRIIKMVFNFDKIY